MQRKLWSFFRTRCYEHYGMLNAVIFIYTVHMQQMQSFIRIFIMYTVKLAFKPGTFYRLSLV